MTWSIAVAATLDEAASAPLLSRSLVIGLFSLLHLALAAPAVAFMVLAPLAEQAGIRRPFFTDEARTLTRFTVVTFAASSVLAVVMIELFVGLFPLTNIWLFNQFRLPVYVGSAAFLLMAVTLLAYFFWWDALRAKSVRLHIGLGAVAAASVLLWAAILDGMGSYMLTPIIAGSSWGSLVNPTWVPLMVHRFGGDVATAGYLAAGYAIWMMGRRTAHQDEAYYLHFFKTAFGIALLGLLVQPATGLVYALRIEHTVPAAYEQLITGPYQGWVLLQFVLVGLLFLGSYWILILGLPSDRMFSWHNSLVLFNVVLMVLFVGQPPARRLFTFVIVGMFAWRILESRRALLALGPAQVNRPAVRLTAVALAMVSLLTYLTMGVIRETARRPDTVRGHISLQEEAQSSTALR